MDEDIKRAAYMLKIAADYIAKHCPGQTIDYDETTCDIQGKGSQ